MCACGRVVGQCARKSNRDVLQDVRDWCKVLCPRASLTNERDQCCRTYQGLTKTSPLKAGTALKLPLPIDIRIGDDPPPPPDPMNVGVVLVHYVGGSEEETEWVYTCSKRMRLSADKLWNSVAVEAAQEMENLLAPDPDAWKTHSKKVLKRVKKHNSSWPFWEPFWSEQGGEEEAEAPDYLQVIQEPMCLDMVDVALEANKYESPNEFARHMRLIFQNAKHYNPPEHEYYKLAEKVLAVFEVPHLPTRLLAISARGACVASGPWEPWVLVPRLTRWCCCVLAVLRLRLPAAPLSRSGCVEQGPCREQLGARLREISVSGHAQGH